MSQVLEGRTRAVVRRVSQEGRMDPRLIDPAPMAYVGQKQAVNAPLDFGPYEGLTKRSWPGDRPVPNPERLITIYFSTLNGEKRPILVQPSDTVATLRQRIWQKMHGAIKLQELEDDIDKRFNIAIWGGGEGTRHRDVKDIAADSHLPGNAHYSREDLVEPESQPTERTLRKKAPAPRGYQPPLRVAQNGGELEMFLGLIKIEDGLQPPIAQTVNTGAPPRFVEATLTEAGIREGCVLRVEYAKLSSEIKDKRVDRGAMDDWGTLAWRATETLLDPDWYVSSVESTPSLAMELLGVTHPSMDTSGKCGSNCDRAGAPHQGFLVPIGERPSDKKVYKSQYKWTENASIYGQPVHQPHVPFNPIEVTEYRLGTRPVSRGVSGIQPASSSRSRSPSQRVSRESYGPGGVYTPQPSDTVERKMV